MNKSNNILLQSKNVMHESIKNDSNICFVCTNNNYQPTFATYISKINNKCAYLTIKPLYLFTLMTNI